MSSWRLLDRGDAHGFDAVAQVAGRIPQGRRGLALAGAVDRAHPQLVRAFVRREGGAPAAERVAAEVLAQLRRLPVLAAVGGEGHFADAVAAVEGDAAHFDRFAGMKLRAVADA